MAHLILIIPILVVMATLYWFFRCVSAVRAPAPGLGAFGEEAGVSACFPTRRRGLERKDALPLLLITAIYAVVAFVGLGDTTAPENFHNFAPGRENAVEFSLQQPREISGLLYYGGLYHGGSYTVTYSLDGENYTELCSMEQSHPDVFKWHRLELPETTTVQYLRIYTNRELELGELVLLDASGQAISNSELEYAASAAELFDEPETVPEDLTPDFKNGMYFDEIYHGRTAYEHIHNIQPYEITHPPLGKILLGLGIRLFGMVPLGWRFVGTLCGVIMLPLLYVFVKNLSGSTVVAGCGTAIFAFDFMHFVQTRLATIDTYAVLFILLAYLFLYRWLSSGWDSPEQRRRDRWLPLALSGICWGVGCASKWTVIYAGAGLAAIWLLHWIFRGRGLCRAGHGRRFRRELGESILCCVLFFILAPAVIYYLSYTPYGTAAGLSAPGMYFTRDYLQIVLDNQHYMLNYHVGVEFTHPYSSSWYQWLVDARPILYWRSTLANGWQSSFAAFLNPLVCWGGLLCMLYMAFRSLARRDKKALFILVGYLSQLLPWILVPRLTFAYHYFPCLVFLVLGICHTMALVRQSSRNWKKTVYGFTGACVLLFALFYPVLSGAAAPAVYERLLAWFPSWPF